MIFRVLLYFTCFELSSGTIPCGGLPKVVINTVIANDPIATIFDGVSELQQADGGTETLCEGCYAIRCALGSVVRRFPDRYNLPIISCVDGRWTFQNPRRANLVQHATNAAGQLRSKCNVKLTLERFYFDLHYYNYFNSYRILIFLT